MKKNLCEIMKMVKFEDGMIIFKKNDPPDNFYLILGGNIALFDVKKSGE